MYREKLAISGAEPVLLAEAKGHTKVEIPDDDALITSAISASRRWAEDYTKRKYVVHQIKLTLDEAELCNPLILEPISEIASVATFTGFDPDNTTTTVFVLDADFRIQNNTLIIESDGIINGTTVREFGAFEIDYTTKLNTIDLFNVKQAILFIIAHWYENREEASIDIVLRNVPAGAKACLASEKKWVF